MKHDMKEEMQIEDLGPLPEPELSHYAEKFQNIYRKLQAENARFKTEVAAWRTKYEQVYNEQMQTKSTENHLRAKLSESCNERDHFKTKSQALLEIIFELIERRDDSK